MDVAVGLSKMDTRPLPFQGRPSPTNTATKMVVVIVVVAVQAIRLPVTVVRPAPPVGDVVGRPPVALVVGHVLPTVDPPGLRGETLVARTRPGHVPSSRPVLAANDAVPVGRRAVPLPQRPPLGGDVPRATLRVRPFPRRPSLDATAPTEDGQTGARHALIQEVHVHANAVAASALASEVTNNPRQADDRLVHSLVEIS